MFINKRVVTSYLSFARSVFETSGFTIRKLSSQPRDEFASFLESSDVNNRTFDDHEYIDTAHAVNYELDRVLPKNDEEFHNLQKLPSVSPIDARSLNVAIIGMPNVGKSTLVNQLVGTRVSSISKRVHTTRRNIIGIMQKHSTQVVFVDTPGLVTSEHCHKHLLEQTFMSHPNQGSRLADLILVVVDASNRRDRESLNLGIVDKLKKNIDKTSALVINKVDSIGSKRMLIDISTRLSVGHMNGQPLPDVGVERYQTPITAVQELRRIRNIEQRVRRKGHIVDIEGISNTIEEEELVNLEGGWKNFDSVFMVSALNGDGIDDLRDYLVSKSVSRRWSYHPSQITALSPSQIVYNVVREKMLDELPREIPYTLTMQIQSWDVTRSGTIAICVDIYSPKSRYMAIILGPGGKTIQKVSLDVKSALCDAFKSDVLIQLVVKNRDNKSQTRKVVPKLSSR